MPRPSKGFKLHMDQTRPSSDILWGHSSHVNIARVLIGWQLPTHVCQSFTRQIRGYQHEKVGEKVGKSRCKFYLSPTVCKRVCRLLCRSHAPTWVCQHEFANFSFPCEGRFRNIHRYILSNVFQKLFTKISRERLLFIVVDAISKGYWPSVWSSSFFACL